MKPETQMEYQMSPMNAVRPTMAPDVTVEAVRFATSFFGKGQFISESFERPDRGYILRQELRGSYYQPLGRRLDRIPWPETFRNREQSEICKLVQTVEVTEIEQAKGLEFDYVVLVDVSAEHYPDLPEARRRLHVGATRAVHQLWLTSVGTPSALVRDLA